MNRNTKNILETPPRREKLADQLYGKLMQAIIDGTFKKGEKLPSEHRICEHYSVSRPVVREALMRLQVDGIVVSRQGSGSYIQRIPPAGLTQYADASDVALLLKSYEVRIALECEASALATERRSDEQLKQLRNALEDMKEDFSQGRIASQADFTFHMVIAEATGNDMFPNVLESIHMDIEKAMNMALNITKRASQERIDKVLDEHYMIYAAIEQGDAEGARLAMRHHINRVRQRVTDNLSDT
ncbi:FadR/GntR family transcriptional regulator [Aidingimonas lacisalsi]|uniref:FadR/GntR family transcriptional regulator n=1 Tax=Aidingimonas lacisalsi TaxID=2604086 RepID=UPI0011D1ADC4|nr:FadR/GntR family transcriptional regulator [Aidingimonas lacisalsi]